MQTGKPSSALSLLGLDCHYHKSTAGADECSSTGVKLGITGNTVHNTVGNYWGNSQNKHSVVETIY